MKANKDLLKCYLAIGEAQRRRCAQPAWSQHGIYGAGRDLDETFGLVETVKKAGGIYMKIARLPRKQAITDEALHRPEAHFCVQTREGYLN